MHYSLLASILVLSGISAALAEQAPPPALPSGSTVHAPRRIVYLNNLVLEELKTSRPHPFAEAQRIMAAASELCAPGPLQLWHGYQAVEGRCNGFALRTSNPPKRQISCQLDDTRYIALVTIKGAEPEFRPAVPDDRPTPVTPAR